MAQTVKLKRSAVSGNVPSTGDLALGEIAINTYDGKIFIKKNDGTESIVTFSAGGNAGSIEEDSFTGNGNTTAFTISTAPSTEENLLVFIDAAFQNRDSFTISGTTVTFDTAPDNGSSIRIYHVIPGTVDDGILTVAKFAASAIVTEAEGISSNDNDTTIPTSAAVKDYVDTQVATVDTLPEVLANGNTTGGTNIAVSAADDITFTDTSKAIFGTDSDLELYHNGSNAFLTNTTGDLYIQDTNGSIRIRPKTGESGIDVLADGAVNLYYDNTSVLSTTADGILVTSEVEASEFIGDLRGAVLFKAQAGENVTKGDVVYISGISGNTTVVSKADADDASKMPAFGIVAATTTSGQPVDIYTQGILSDLDTSSYSEGDELFVSTTAGALTDTAPTGETALLQKIAKVTRSNALSGSIFITGAGRTNAVPNLDQDQFFLGNASNQAVATDFSDAVEALSINNVVEDTTPQLGGTLDTNGNLIQFGDSSGGTVNRLQFGASQDLQIHHDGTHSYLLESNATGNLYLGGDNLYLSNANVSKTYLKGTDGGAVELRYDNAAKLATTSAGIDVTGDVSIGDGSSTATRLLMGAGDDSKMFHNGVDTYWINDTGNIIIRNQSDDKDILLQTDDGAGGYTTYITVDGSETDVSLHYGGSEKLATTSTGINVTGTVTGDGLVVDGLSTLSSNNNATPLSIVRASATSDQTGISFNAGGNTRYIGKGTDDEPYWATSANLTAGSKIVTSGNFTGILDSTYYQSGDDISVGNITATGYLRGPSTFTIDPATHGDDTGTVVIAGNLQVDGTTTTINSTTLTVDDKLITLASGSINAAAADGAGIEVDITGSTNPSLTYDGTNDEWDFNKSVRIASDDATTLVIESTDSTNTATIKFKPRSDRNVAPFITSTARGATASDGDLQLGDEGGTILTLNAGKAGIGTTSPGTALHIAASVPTITLADTDVSTQATISGNGGYLNLDSHTGQTIRFSIGASEKARIDSSGVIRVGTISGQTNAKLTIREATNDIEFGHANVTSGYYGTLGASYTNGLPFLALSAEADSSGNTFTTRGIKGNIIQNAADGSLTFSQATTASASGQTPAERMRIDSSGNVGIGTSSPDVPLEVVSASPTNGIVADFVNSTNAGGTTAAIKLSNADSEACDVVLGANRTGANFGSDFFISLSDGVDGSNQERFRITEAGNVGIGTTSPVAKLDVLGTNAGPTVYDYSYATNSGIRIHGDEAGMDIVGTDANNHASSLLLRNGNEGFAFINNSTSNRLELRSFNATADTFTVHSTGTNVSNLVDLLTLEKTGNVGIGTNSPADTLHVNGRVRTNTSGIALSDTNAVIYRASNDLEIRTYAGYDINLIPSGNVGIGTTTPSAKLQVEEYGIDTTETSTTATTQVAIHTFAAATFRSARFTIQVTNSTDSTYHLTEILMIHDGTTPSITEYGTIFTGSAAEATFDADISSGNVRLLATPASTDTMEFKVVSHSITT